MSQVNESAGRDVPPTMDRMALLPADARITSVRLRVASLERSLAFYTDVLGLAVHGRHGRAAAVGPAGGPVLFDLEEDPHATPRPPGTSGLFHVAVLLPDREWLGLVLRRLFEQPWPLTGAADHLVSEALYLDDPDGLGLEIYRDRPRETWRTENGEILMATERLDVRSLAADAGTREWQALPASTTIGHVHLNVPDLPAAEDLYCGDIGFTPTLRRYPGALFVSAGGYHHHLGLNVWAGRGAPAPPPGTVGLSAFTIEGTNVVPCTIEDQATGVAIVCRGRG